MKKTRRLMEMAGIKHRSDLILEEEGDDAEDLFGDDEGGDEEADEGGDDEEADDGGDEGDEDEEAPDQLSSKEVAELGPDEIDLELSSIMDDIFDKSQKAYEAGVQSESLHKTSMSRHLFENSGYKDIKINESVDFQKLYESRKIQ